jgi:hypothetical protein
MRCGWWRESVTLPLTLARGRNRTEHFALFVVMAVSSPFRQERVSFLERLGKMLHVQYDEVVNEPLPQRWVDLIHYLNTKEQEQPKAHQPEDAPQVRRPRSS